MAQRWKSGRSLQSSLASHTQASAYEFQLQWPLFSSSNFIPTSRPLNLQCSLPRCLRGRVPHLNRAPLKCHSPEQSALIYTNPCHCLYDILFDFPGGFYPKRSYVYYIFTCLLFVCQPPQSRECRDLFMLYTVVSQTRFCSWHTY